MPRPIYAEIDIQALKHNLARLRESVGDRTLWAVVKANAYGHGDYEISTHLEKNGVKVEAPDISEIMKGRGALHCITAYLKRG